MRKKNSVTVHFKPIILPLSLSKSWRSELLLLVVTVTTLQCHFSGKSKMGSQWNTQTGTTLGGQAMSHRSRFSWPISRKVQTVESVWSTSVFSWNLCSFFDDVDCQWSFSWRESLETINYSLECAGTSSVAKCLTFCANCRTTFLSLRSFISQSLHMLLPFPGGFTNLSFFECIIITQK